MEILWSINFTLLGIILVILLAQLIGHYVLFCSGSSMKPTMNYVGIVYGTKPEKYSVGDIVGFYRKSRFFLNVHRVIKIEGNMVYIKGDNAPEIDVVPIKQVLFKVTKHISII